MCERLYASRVQSHAGLLGRIEGGHERSVSRVASGPCSSQRPCKTWFDRWGWAVVSWAVGWLAGGPASGANLCSPNITVTTVIAGQVRTTVEQQPEE